MALPAMSAENYGKGLWLPVAAVVMVQVAFAFMNVLVKQVLSAGMSRFALITYRQAVAVIFISPLAYFVERGKRPKMTRHVFMLIFLSALLGMTGSQHFFFYGLEHTSATFGCAFINLTPVFTFLFALALRMESVHLRSKSGLAKVLGTVVCLSGAMLMTLYKGRALINHSAPNHHQAVAMPPPMGAGGIRLQRQWILGCLSLLAGNVAYSSWFIIQARIAKAYPALYSNNAIVSLLSFLQSGALTLALERDPTTLWALKRKLQVVTIVYAGVVGSGVAYISLAWCVKQRGPVFTAAFSPLVQVLVAIIEVIFLNEQLHQGSVIGSVMIVIGLYVLLCGKSKENEAQTVQANEGKIITPSTTESV